MKIYSALTNDEINEQVFNYQQGKPTGANWGKWCGDFAPCINPADAWSIIVDNKIDIEFGDNVHGTLVNCAMASNGVHSAADTNPLRAAMIVYLMMMDAKT